MSNANQENNERYYREQAALLRYEAEKARAQGGWASALADALSRQSRECEEAAGNCA